VTVEPLRHLDDERARYAYAPGKWTIAEVVGHMGDAERVMSIRALRFARGDETPLPGFDENAYTPAGEFGGRSFASLLDELVAIRRATISLFANLPDAAWTRSGRASDAPVSVRALACIIAGHELHHRALFAERYGVALVSAS
ncbi:MAG: DinB family protein, partial [Longimicrobiales bacterium]